MMTMKMMKKTAVLALVGVLGYGGLGAAEVSAHPLRVPQQERAAYTGMDGRAEVQQQQIAWGGHRKNRKGGKKYSQGSVNTAIIAGAVIGAIIAKNT